MVWGGRMEEGSGWGTHVNLWWIHFDIWQNQYNTVKLKNKIVSGLMFRSLIHFEFIFLYGVRKCSSFILLQVVDQFSGER